MDPIHLFSTPLSNSASLLLHPTNGPIVIPFHRHRRMIPLLLHPPSLLLRPFHSPKITCSASLGGGNGRRRGKRRRRKLIGSADIAALRRAFSFAASFRPPAEPLDILLLFQNGGTGGGGGGRRGFWSRGTGGGGEWPKRRMPWKKGGLVGLLLSLAVTAAASALGRTGEKDLGMRLLVPALLGLKKSRAWRREVGVLILGFAFLLLLLKTVGQRIKNGRRRIVWRF